MRVSENKNVLYISYDGMTDALGQSQVMPYIIGLTKQGYNFTILSCEKKSNYDKNHKKISGILNSASINWEPIFYTKNPPVLSTLYDYYKLLKRAKSLNKQHGFGLVHCRSYIPSLIGLWMNKTLGIPFIFDMRGFWADERVDGNLWNLKNPLFSLIYKFFKKKETEFLNNSAAIISLTNAGKNEILTWKNLGFSPDKIAIIPCCVDTELFNPSSVPQDKQKAIRELLNINPTDFIIGYLGSIGTWYMLDEMLMFFYDLKKAKPNAKFLFVTNNDEEEIYNKAKLYNINLADIIITQADRKDVPVYISLFNYGLFFIKPSYSKKSSSPTKQAEIMAMGVPIICNAGVGDTDSIIELNNAGIVIKNNKFDVAIQSILAETDYDESNIRETVIESFSLDSGVKKYSKVYNSIQFQNK